MLSIVLAGLVAVWLPQGAFANATEFDFDLLDSHFVYPNGVLASALGKRYGKPVVITGRGEDIAHYPNYPIIGKQIRVFYTPDCCMNTCHGSKGFKHLQFVLQPVLN